MKTYALACLVLAGCAAPSNTPTLPKPGSGLAEYRQITGEAQRAMAGTIESLEALGRASVAASQSPQLARFDKAFDQLELTSIRARSRAEAIIARGQSYFDEWKQRLTAATPSGQAEYDRLYDHFTLIRQRSREVRDEFRPFMASLRQFRAQFGEASTAQIDALTTSGRRVIKCLESVSTALNDAEAELHAMHLSKR